MFTPMSPQFFVACHTCRAAERLCPAGDADLAPQNDLRDFLPGHDGHLIEVVRRVGDAIVSDRPVWDPLAITYVMVGGGHGTMLLKSERRSIDSPTVRTILPGKLRAQVSKVELDAELFVAALRAHFFPYVLPTRAVEHVLRGAAASLRTVDLSALEVLFDSPDDPRVSFASPPQQVLAAIEASGKDACDANEAAALREFIARHGQPGGAILLRVIRSWTIELEQTEECRAAG